MNLNDQTRTVHNIFTHYQRKTKAQLGIVNKKVAGTLGHKHQQSNMTD